MRNWKYTVSESVVTPRERAESMVDAICALWSVTDSGVLHQV